MEEEEKTGNEILQQFSQYLKDDGKASSTIESYLGDITAFIAWLEEKSPYFDGKMKRFHVTSYRSYIQQHGFSVVTINKKINSLQSFNAFLMNVGYMQELVVDVKKDKVKIAAGSEKEVEILKDKETEQLMFHGMDRNKVNARDCLMVNMLLYTGLRVSEMVSLQLRDIDLLTNTLTVAWGKGFKYREVPLRQDMVEAIKEYMGGERKESEFNTSEYLLLTQRAGKMDRDTVNKVLKRMGRELRIDLYPHKFRHTFCSRLLKKGVPITTVAKLAGHSSINTTSSFYINTSKQDKMEAVNLL